MSNAQMPIAIPDPDRPGVVHIPALGKSFEQIELREDDVVDTEDIPSGSQAADKKITLFDSSSKKGEQHATFTQNRRLPAGDEAAVFRVGLHIRGAIGNSLIALADLRKAYENGAVRLKFNRRLITEGSALKYQSGYGLYGSTTENNGSLVSNGVPSVNSAPILFVPQSLNHSDDIFGEYFLPGAEWITDFTYTAPNFSTGLVVSMFLRAIIKSPLGK